MKTISVVLEKTEQLLQMKYSGTTPQNYIAHIRRFLEFSKNVPTRVNNEDVLDYQLSILDRSESYRNVAISAIKAFFLLYFRKELKGFSSIRPKNPIKKPKYISNSHFLNCYSKVNNTKHRLLFALGYQLGLRSDEARSIRVEDVYLDDYCIRINGKGSKQRFVYFKDYLYCLLVSYVEDYNPGSYLVEGRNGKYSQSSLSNLMNDYFAGFTFHNLRHSYAQSILDDSGNLKLTADALGHSTVRTTEKSYVIGNNKKACEYAPSLV